MVVQINSQLFLTKLWYSIKRNRSHSYQKQMVWCVNAHKHICKHRSKAVGLCEEEKRHDINNRKNSVKKNTTEVVLEENSEDND